MVPAGSFGKLTIKDPVKEAMRAQRQLRSEGAQVIKNKKEAFCIYLMICCRRLCFVLCTWDCPETSRLQDVCSILQKLFPASTSFWVIIRECNGRTRVRNLLFIDLFCFIFLSFFFFFFFFFFWQIQSTVSKCLKPRILVWATPKRILCLTARKGASCQPRLALLCPRFTRLANPMPKFSPWWMVIARNWVQFCRWSLDILPWR